MPIKKLRFLQGRLPRYDLSMRLEMNYHYKSFHGKLFRVLFAVTLCAFIPSALDAAKPGPAAQPSQEQKKEEPKAKSFHVQFFSLKRGHSIAPGTMILYDRGTLEIKIEHAALTTSRATCTVAGYIFQAEWEFTAKKEKSYHYVCHFTGLYLFDTYITGLVTLKEFVEEGRLTQDIPFIFFAAASAK